MRFYHSDYQTVIDMPLKAFWGLYKKIDQLQAGEDLHTISVPGYGSSKESFEKFIAQALKLYGHPVTYDTTHEKLDHHGLNELKRLANGR